MYTNLRSRLLNILAPALLITLNLFLFGPSTVYKGNAVEFSFPLVQLLLVYLLPFFGLLALLVAVALPLRPKTFRIYTALLITLGLMLWVQGSFLVWKYGLFDGNGIDWKLFRYQGWVDLAVWLAACALIVGLRNKIAGYFNIMSWALIAVQGALFIVTAISPAPSSQPLKTKAVEGVPDDLYNYSDSLNVVHFMMDHFQTDVFLEVMQEGGFEKDLEGFTLFRDNMANANTTAVSIPSIFSGNIFDGTMSVGENFRHNISKFGFHHILHDKGFKINFVPHIKMPDSNVTNYYTIPESGSRSIREERVFKATWLLDISLFRHLPQPAKQFIYDNNNWFISKLFSESPNERIMGVFSFLDTYTNSLKLSGHQPVYHYIFIDPPHPPYVLDEKGNFAGTALPPKRENYKNQARFTLGKFITYINALKNNGLYNKTLIVLQSDHGAFFKPYFNGQVSNIELERVPALLAVKPVGATGPLVISDAETMNADIPATILDLVGIPSGYPGMPVFEIKPGQVRTRPFVTQTDLWEVRGPIYDALSWEKKSELGHRTKNPQYFWGKIIRFGLLGNAYDYKDTGWSTALDGYEWNNGKKFTMKFLVDPPQSDVLLEMSTSPFLHENKVTKQNIIVMVNGREAGKWLIDQAGLQTLSLLIPKALFREKEQTLEFVCPDAISPKTLDISLDLRELALAVYSVTMKEQTSFYTPGTKIDFSVNGNAGQYLIDGWGSPESEWRWTVGNSARLVLNFKENVKGDLNLRLHGLAFLAEGKLPQQNVTVLVNDKSVANWAVKTDADYTAKIPAALIRDGRAAITLKIATPKSPSETGKSTDTRKLGIAVKSIILESTQKK